MWGSSTKQHIESVFVLHVSLWVGHHMVHNIASQLHNILGPSREAFPPVLLLWHRGDEVVRFDQLEAKER